jgi:hypothetical protein
LQTHRVSSLHLLTATRSILRVETGNLQNKKGYEDTVANDNCPRIKA